MSDNAVTVPDVEPLEDPNEGWLPENWRTMEDQLPDPEQTPQDLGLDPGPTVFDLEEKK